jgi:hypothetical protein
LRKLGVKGIKLKIQYPWYPPSFVFGTGYHPEYAIRPEERPDVASLIASHVFDCGCITVFHLSLWQTVVILLGYGVCANVDRWLAKWEIEKIIDDEIYGWEKDTKDRSPKRKGI